MCGITGYVGNKPSQPSILKLIMLYNMSRGEDGTGWAINNKITKDTIKVSDFLTKNSLITSKENSNYTVIAHARKSSSGSKLNKTLVHPFGFKLVNDIPVSDLENPELVLCMNGTYTNLSEMAKKYKVEYTISVNSDTEILSKILLKVGKERWKEVLGDYAGSGTLLFYLNSEPNTLYVYKCKERPMFFYKKGEGLYFSSLIEALEAVKDQNDNKIYTLEDDTLFKFEGLNIVKQEKIERNPLKPEVYISQSNYSTYNHKKESKTIGIKARNLNHSSIEKSTYYILGDRYYKNNNLLHGRFCIADDGTIGSINDKDRFFVFGYEIKNEELFKELVKNYYKDEITSEKNFLIEKWNEFFIGDYNKYFLNPYIAKINTQGKTVEYWLFPDINKSELTENQEVKAKFFLSEYTLYASYIGKSTKSSKIPVFKEVKVEINKLEEYQKVLDHLLKTEDTDKFLNLLNEELEKAYKAKNLHFDVNTVITDISFKHLVKGAGGAKNKIYLYSILCVKLGNQFPQQKETLSNLLDEFVLSDLNKSELPQKIKSILINTERYRNFINEINTLEEIGADNVIYNNFDFTSKFYSGESINLMKDFLKIPISPITQVEKSKNELFFDAIVLNLNLIGLISDEKTEDFFKNRLITQSRISEIYEEYRKTVVSESEEDEDSELLSQFNEFLSDISTTIENHENLVETEKDKEILNSLKEIKSLMEGKISV